MAFVSCEKLSKEYTLITRLFHLGNNVMHLLTKGKEILSTYCVRSVYANPFENFRRLCTFISLVPYGTYQGFKAFDRRCSLDMIFYKDHLFHHRLPVAVSKRRPLLLLSNYARYGSFRCDTPVGVIQSGKGYQRCNQKNRFNNTASPFMKNFYHARKKQVRMLIYQMP